MHPMRMTHQEAREAVAMGLAKALLARAGASPESPYGPRRVKEEGKS